MANRFDRQKKSNVKSKKSDKPYGMMAGMPYPIPYNNGTSSDVNINMTLRS